MNRTDALEATRTMMRAVSAAEQSDWRIDRSAEAITLTSPTGESAVDLEQTLKGFLEASSTAELDGRFGGASLSIFLGKDGTRRVSSTSTGDPGEAFTSEMAKDAREAWAGNATKALSLPGEWTAKVQLAPAHFLEAAHLRAIVMRDTAALEELIDATPFWTFANLASPAAPLEIFVESLSPENVILSEAIRIQSLQDDTPRQNVDSPDSPDMAVVADFPLAIDPRSLALTQLGTELEPVAVRLYRIAAGLAWLTFASAAHAHGANTMSLEFFGYQRLNCLWTRSGPEVDRTNGQAAIRLYEWAREGRSPDFVLAIRQVASLYGAREPWAHADDVRKAAEPIVMALRSEVVADVLRSKRELQSGATTLALQSAERASSLARNTVERSLATLFAIGGVIVAESLHAISADTASVLRGLLGGILIAVALWSYFFEGSFATSPIHKFEQDLPTLGDLLTAADRRAIADLATLRSAKRRAWMVRICVPVAYVAVGLAIWFSPW